MLPSGARENIFMSITQLPKSPPEVSISKTLGIAETSSPTHGDGFTTTEDRTPEPITIPGLHETVQKVVAKLPRGSLLDVGAGQGAFSLWAREQNFTVTATDVDPNNYFTPTIPFQQADLGGPWPFADASFDIVVSIEVLEHVENHYHFLRECCRVCKPGGRIVLSTPNCHSIEARLNYFLTGFDDCAPQPINHKKPALGSIYMEHIHPAPLPIIELGLRRCGFEIERVAFNRRRRLATALLPLLYPFFWWRTFRHLILREHDADSRKHNRKLMRLLLDPKMLTGRIAVFTCRNVVDPEMTDQ